MTAPTTNAISSYSPFFSSGLLAPHTPRLRRQNTFNSDISEPWDDRTDYSSSCPSSPVTDSVMDFDIPDFIEAAKSPDARRSVTPTPESEQATPIPSPYAFKPSVSTVSDARPRLRKRRSSLTQGASPMHAIRSPTRSAGDALRLQMQLPRGRSGSLGGESLGIYGGIGMGSATDETSLVGRMRSGSCSSANMQSTNVQLRTVTRPHRLARRIHTMPIPAPAPPPTAPLPALPTPTSDMFAHQTLRPTDLNLAGSTFMSNSGTKSIASTSARARGFSVSNSALGGEANRIDEEMKEN